MKKLLLLLYFFFIHFTINASMPNGYYDSATGSGYTLKTQLKDIITNGHIAQSYDALFTLYQTADVDKYYENDGTLLDMYSEIHGGADSYEYSFNASQECGNYSTEGDCYNREHLMPQSVFNSASPMVSDGHFVVPSDGYVNGKRNNYAFGIVTNPTWTSTNGSKLGPNNTVGYSSTFFEPIDEFKGDISRALFYFATRYEDQVSGWSHDMLNGTSDQVFSDWFLDILLQWNSNDPVSQKELDRNEAVYNFQGNRNPYIDHPEWVGDIWGNTTSPSPSPTNTNSICVDEDFVDFSDWTNNGTAEDTSDVHYGAASPCRAFASGDYMISPSVDNPNTLEFHQDASNSGDGETVTIDYQIGSNGWVQLYSFTADKNGVDESVDLTNVNSVDLSAETDVTFKFNDPSGGTWYLDDVVVHCGASSSNDTDAYASSGTQPAAANIDSMKDTSAEAVDVFVMDIIDQGTADGLGTNITNIRIKPYITNTADWTDNIQGFVIKNGATTITPASVNITDTYADFSFNSGDVVVPDNDLIELIFSVYLNTSNIEDTKILSFYIDADDHGFTADASGTQFETTFEDGDFHSNDFTIDVSVSKLIFAQQPYNLEISQVMTPSVVVNAVDDNGNIDIDFDGAGSGVGLTTTGSFDATATTQVDAVQGVATFDNLIFDTTASGITLTTTDPDSKGYTNATSNPFDVTVPAAGCSELFISEYGEPSSGNGKYIEIYNPTGNPIDLSNYQLWKIVNGGNWPEDTFSLSGTIQPYDVWVVGYSTSDVPGADQTSTSFCNFNGNDAMGLAYDDGSGFSLIDAIGTSGADPGSGWDVAGITNATVNHTLVRKNTVDGPNSDWASSAGTNSSDSEWQVLSYSQSDLGTHLSDCQAPVPEIRVEGNSIEIVNGDNTPSTTDHTDFGDVDYNSGSLTYTFTIKNVGNADLNLTDPSPYVTLSGDTGDFTLSAIPLTPISSGSSTTFDITFDPTTYGDRSVTVSIANDDSDENPYTFTLKGNGTSTDEVDWANLQYPETGAIQSGDNFNVYAQVYELDVTDTSGQGAGITVWIGYSTVDNDPTNSANAGDWSWKEATYNTDSGNNDEYMADIGVDITTAGTYYYASRFQINGGPYKYGGYNGGFWDNTFANHTGNYSGKLTVDEVEWCNIQTPGSGTQTLGNAFDIYIQVLDENYTNAAGQASNIQAWVGYSTADNDPTDPANAGDWTWAPTTYNTDVGNNDEYKVDLAGAIGTAGTYYYVSRFQVKAGPYAYGGFNDGSNEGPWDSLYSSGTGNKSGQLILNAPQEILVEGNGNEIVNGDATPSVTDDTAFGDVLPNTTVTHTFTIKNTGDVDLNLTGSPIVAISGDAAFSIQTQPSNATIAGGGSETFVVQFAPTTAGSFTATISIDNNDSDENPYTFTVSGTASYSNESDVITNNNEAVTIPSTINDATINTTSDGIEVWQFTIRDGGADLSDADSVDTTVNNITFTQGSGNAINDWNDAILACALFDGNTKIADATTVNVNTIQFTGLNIVVPDDSSKTLSLRMSIQTSPNDTGGNLDGDDFQFQISNANITADVSGSQFASFSAAKSENGKNILDVTATQLMFTIQPANIGQNSVMIPEPQLAAVDANGNIDLDFNGTVSLTSSGTMTGDPITENAINGEVTFTNVIHTVIESGVTLTASASGLGSVTSNPFDVLEQTILEPGDLAILAVNTDLGSGVDQIAFVCFKDINPGTKIYLTDNGYERQYAGKWGGTEGVISITRKNITLPKGTIITFESTNQNVAQLSDFDIWTCGSVDANWTKTALSGGSIGGFNLNSNDDVWIMQGGTWVNDTGHQSTYDGTVLYGWTESGWDDTAPDGTTDRGTEFSNLIPHSACFTTTAPSGGGKVKFNNPNDPDFSSTSNDQLDWIALINTSGNWDTYIDNTTYNNNGFNYKGDTNCPQMTIAASSHTAGRWQGNKDTNWFNCSNWDNLTVPSSSTDVIIPNSASNNVSIDITAQYSDIYNDIAQAHNLLLENSRTLTMTNTGDLLEVYGNWDNQAGETAFVEGQGNVKFVGTAIQTLTCNSTDTEHFYNLVIGNPSGVTFTSGNIYAVNDLSLLNSPTVIITDGHYMYAGHNLVNNVNLIIENEGALVQSDNAGSISGSGTFKLNKTSLELSNYYDYVYWSTPINSSTFTLGDILPNAWGYYSFDPSEASNGHRFPGWVTESANTVPEIGLGYAISAYNSISPNTILNVSFVKDHDPFNNGQIDRLVLRKGGPDNIGNFNLLGNPYPSAIDFHQLYAENDTIIKSAYSLWTNCAGLDPSTGRHQSAGYTTYIISGTAVQACSDSGKTASRYIPSGQGFMVEAQADSLTLSFNNTQRVLNDNTNFLNKPNLSNRDILWLDMFDDNGSFNQIAVGFYENALNTFDSMYDAHTMNNGSGFALYSQAENEKLAIQGLSRHQIDNQLVKLGVELNLSETIHFKLNHMEGFDNYDIYLKDNLTGKMHDLKNAQYTTQIKSGVDENRFELVFARPLDVDEVLADSNNLMIKQMQDLIELELKNDGLINSVQVYNLNGQLLISKTSIKAKTYRLQLSNVARGNLLLFKIYNNKKQVYTKKIIFK